MRLASLKNISVSLESLTSLTRREKCNILCNLRDSQTSKIIIHSEKLVLDPKFSQGSRVKISNDSRESHYKISVCETCKSRCKICLRDSRVLLQNFSAILAISKSCCKISFCKSREKRVSLLILTRESRKNLARILGLKSESCFSREFKK
jgi:hypothetical protein